MEKGLGEASFFNCFSWNKRDYSPDYIFETSWEVCNKVGGIYTVLSTRARTLKTGSTTS